MAISTYIHSRHVAGRRVKVISGHFADLIPASSGNTSKITVLDVGCGDGSLTAAIIKKRLDVTAKGVDILIRDKTYVPVNVFNGRTIPYPDSFFDIVMFSDVLHHTKDPMILLKEAKRVSDKFIIIKDHILNGVLAYQTLKFMDIIGNSRYRVSMPFNYWSEKEWFVAFECLGLKIEVWQKSLGLYPWPTNYIFERSLHFITRLKVAK